MQRYFNTKNAFRCQILVLLDYRFQFSIKILSEEVLITNFISKSLEFIELLICEKIAGVMFVSTKLDEKLQKYSNTKNAFRCQILELRDGGAYVCCKMYFSNSSGVHPLVGCTGSAWSSSPNT